MKTTLLLICAFSASLLYSQEPGAPYKYRVSFKDKAGSPYSVHKPEEFLSSAAIERRKKQNISISENDLPVNEVYVNGVTSLGVKLLNRSKWFNDITIELMDTTLLTKVRALPYVTETRLIAKTKPKSAESESMQDMINMVERMQAEKIKKNPPTGLHKVYGLGEKQILMLNGDKLHEKGFDGKGMTIAILDAGFYRVDEYQWFDSLRTSGRILGTRDFVTGGTSVYEDNSHGLSVLSTIGANIPGTFVGTAPGASFWLLRTEDAESEYLIEEDNWVRGAEFADSVGAHIINSSLGYTHFDDPETSHKYEQLNGNTARITKGADMAASKGILVVNSAGNSGADKWKYVGAPADGDSVLSIGAVTPSQAYAGFSSQGPTADGRIKPNVTALGANIMLVTSGGEIGPSMGTSFSGPVIAGMAACLWQSNPDATAMQVYKAIERSGHLYNNPDGLYGFGIPDFERAMEILSQIKNSANVDSIIHVYPNPFVGGVTVEYYSKSGEEFDLKVRNAKGKSVASSKIKPGAQQNGIVHLRKIRKFNPGVYTLEVKTKSGIRTYSFTKKA